MNTKMHKKFWQLAINALLLTMATTALADRPTHITLDPETRTEEDPCTGQLHEVTINFDTYVHLGHSHNEVDRAVITGFTSSGYELIAGNDLVMEGSNVFKYSGKQMWHHEDGRKFFTTGLIVMDKITGEVNASNFVGWCIGGEAFN
jgi:hypothetical protein